jgi:hypothetical protein
MNPADDQLNRLFRSAAQGQPETVYTPPYGLETRVMAAWRTGQSSGTGFWDMTLLVRGLILASLIMALSFLPALTSITTSNSTNNPFAEYLQLTDSTIPPDDTP